MADPTGPLLIPPGGKDAGSAELDPHPAFGLPIGSSVAQSTALPSLGTAWHSANPLKTSLRPLEEGTVQNNADIASQGSSPLGEVRRGLQLLLHHRTPDGRYLMQRRYQWWAVYHVLVRQCGFPDGYREFVACIAQLFPEGLRVPCTESTMKQLSQTHYMEPVSEWRYDALYHGSPERFRLMRETVEWMGEMVNGIVRNGYPIEPT